jgi:hypothetical protein
LPSNRQERNPLPRGRAGRKDKRKRTEPSGDVTVEITDRDVVMMRLLDRYRLLTTDQLFAVAGGNLRAFQKRLQDLFHAEVVYRPPAQFRPGEPARPHIYALGTNGRAHLDALDGLVGRKRNMRAANDRLKLQFLEHETASAEVALAFQLATERQGWAFNVAVADEISSASGLPPGVDVTFRQDIDERLPLRPDLYFTIDAGGARRAYLVEVDLGTEPNIRWNLRTSSILRKVIAYWQVYFWPRTPIDGVLFVTNSKTRLDNMIDVVRRVDRKGLGSHFFQFALLDECRIGSHETLFYEPLFRSAKVGYDNPRLFFLPECPTCHAMLDVHNESVRGEGDALQLVHETCPRDLSSPALS